MKGIVEGKETWQSPHYFLVTQEPNSNPRSNYIVWNKMIRSGKTNDGLEDKYTMQKSRHSQLSRVADCNLSQQQDEAAKEVGATKSSSAAVRAELGFRFTGHFKKEP